MNHLHPTLTAAAALQREADAAGIGRISAADREAAQCIGELLTEFVWQGGGFETIPPESPESGPSIARLTATVCRATASGFGLALAEWLERWAGEEGG